MPSYTRRPSPTFPDALADFTIALGRALRWQESYGDNNFYDRLRRAIADVRGACTALATRVDLEDPQSRKDY